MMNRSSLALVALVLAGCAADPHRPADVDGAITAASNSNRPVLLQFTADSSPLRVSDDRADTVVVDLNVSANRPTAARYHVKDADVPVLLTLTPRGLVVGRDGSPITAEDVRLRVDQAVAQSPRLDGTWARLDRAVAADPGDAAARLALADFLRGHHNDREAIPHLAAVAHDAAVAPPTRVRAWVDLARAHQWVGEPERGRHEAQALIATLGPTAVDATAGGLLVLGLQDVTAKRLDRARDEFEQAIAADPKSRYASEADDQLRALPDPPRRPPTTGPS